MTFFKIRFLTFFCLFMASFLFTSCGDEGGEGVDEDGNSPIFNENETEVNETGEQDPISDPTLNQQVTPPELEVPEEGSPVSCLSPVNDGCPAGQIYDNSTGCCRNRRCDRTVANGEPELAAGGEDQVCNPSTGLWEFPGGCVVPEGMEGPAVSFELQEDETHQALDFRPEGRDPETGESTRPNTVGQAGMLLKGYGLKKAQICGAFSVTLETLENGEEVISPLVSNPDQPGRDLTREIAEGHDLVRCDEEELCPEVVYEEFDTEEDEVYCLTLHPTGGDPTLAESFPFLVRLTQESHRFLPFVSCQENSAPVLVDEDVSSQFSASSYEVESSVVHVTRCDVKPYIGAPYVEVQVGGENATSCRVSVRYGNGESLSPLAKTGFGYDPDGFISVDPSGRIGGGGNVKGVGKKKLVEDGIRYLPIQDDTMDITCSCSGVASYDSEGKKVTFSLEEGGAALAATAQEGTPPLCAQTVYYEDQDQALYTTGENGVREFLNDRCDITLDWHFYNQMKVEPALHLRKVGSGKGRKPKGSGQVIAYNIPWAGKIELVAFRFWGEVGETEPVGSSYWEWEEIRDRVNHLSENEEVVQRFYGSFGALLPDDRFGKPVFQGIPSGRIQAESYVVDGGILKSPPRTSLTGLPSTPFESAPSPGRAKGVKPGKGSGNYQIGWTIDRVRRSYNNPTSNRYALMVTQFGERTPGLIKVIDVRHKSIFGVAENDEILAATRFALEQRFESDPEQIPTDSRDAFPRDMDEIAEIIIPFEAKFLKEDPRIEYHVFGFRRTGEVGGGEVQGCGGWSSCDSSSGESPWQRPIYHSELPDPVMYSGRGLRGHEEDQMPEGIARHLDVSSYDFQGDRHQEGVTVVDLPHVKVDTRFRDILIKIRAEGVDGKSYEFNRRIYSTSPDAYTFERPHSGWLDADYCNHGNVNTLGGSCPTGNRCVARTDSFNPFQEPDGVCVPVIPEGWESEAP